MYIVRVPVNRDDFDTLITSLWEAGTLGVHEGPGWVDAWFEEEATAREFGEPTKAPEVDWVKRTEDAWPPLLVGRPSSCR